jgi:nucleoside 2-deoxyribosyltransferase
MKKRVYIAGPLFSRGELEFNLVVDEHLKNLGFDTFLPQKDGHKLADLVSNNQKSTAVATIFERDIQEIKDSDILLFIMDGRVPDEGACVELGIAYAWNKQCIGLKTDSRFLMDNIDNPLILGALQGKVARSVEELGSFLGVADTSGGILKKQEEPKGSYKVIQ